MARWMFTDARERVACPRCKAEKGEQCRQPKGRPVKYPHPERLKALSELPDFNVEDYQVKSYTPEEAMKKFFT